MHKTKSAAFRQIAGVAIGLAALTVVEYFVGINLPSTVLLFLLALIKAWLVVYFFMHISRLWTPEEGGH